MGNLSGAPVEVIGLAFTVRLDAQIDRRDRRVAKLRRAKGFGVARTDTLEEVIPQGACVLAGLLRRKLLAAFALVGARRGRTAFEDLRDAAETIPGVRLK